jgi:hypothetical protein
MMLYMMMYTYRFPPQEEGCVLDKGKIWRESIVSINARNASIWKRSITYVYTAWGDYNDIYIYVYIVIYYFSFSRVRLNQPALLLRTHQNKYSLMNTIHSLCISEMGSTLQQRERKQENIRWAFYLQRYYKNIHTYIHTYIYVYINL